MGQQRRPLPCPLETVTLCSRLWLTRCRVTEQRGTGQGCALLKIHSSVAGTPRPSAEGSAAAGHPSPLAHGAALRGDSAVETCSSRGAAEGDRTANGPLRVRDALTKYSAEVIPRGSWIQTRRVESVNRGPRREMFPVARVFPCPSVHPDAFSVRWAGSNALVLPRGGRSACKPHTVGMRVGPRQCHCSAITADLRAQGTALAFFGFHPGIFLTALGVVCS